MPVAPSWWSAKRKKPCLAFVLGGGGGRGALQVGAIRALLEANVMPDLLVGTSAGAVNATYLAAHGVSMETLDDMEKSWHDAAQADLLPANYLWLTVRLLFNRVGKHSGHRMRDFYIQHGIEPELCFGDIEGTRLVQVATDLNTNQAVLYGTDPKQSVLDGLLASTAIPPWVQPLESEDRLLMDGGIVSNLPIEPAIRLGASEIVAFSLTDVRPQVTSPGGIGPFFYSLISTVERRQIELELALAHANGVKVHMLELQADRTVPTWDFSRTDELIERGYQITSHQLPQWQMDRQSWWRRLLSGEK